MVLWLSLYLWMSLFLCFPVGDNSSYKFTPRNPPSVGWGMGGGSWICLEPWEVEKALASVAGAYCSHRM